MHIVDGRIVFYCLGDERHGMGHVIRCIHLARALKEIGIESEFVTLEHTAGSDRLDDEFLLNAAFDTEMECEAYLRQLARVWTGRYDGLVIDLEHGPTRALLESVRPLYRKVITLGGVGFAVSEGEAVSQLVDLQIYQSVGPYPPAGISQEQWDASNKLVGPEWLIVDPDLAKCKSDPKGHILVAMGGGDPHRLTEIVMDGLMGIGRPVKVIRGPARPPVAPQKGFEIVDAPEKLTPYLNGASLCICAMGMTTYEAMTAGVPSIVANWSEDHQRTTKILPVLDMGLWNEVTPDKVRQAVAEGAPMPMTLDGRGSFRVAEAICALLS